jgi:hypothetical protein
MKNVILYQNKESQFGLTSRIVVALILFLLLSSGDCFAQNPAYDLIVKNLSLPSSNAIEFDLYIKHTNNPVPFEYSAGQYFFNINSGISNGGTLTYSIIGSDLPIGLQPRSPQVAGNQLRLASNVFPGAGNGFIMTNNPNPGTKIVRMRLQTTSVSLANVPLSLQWRNSLPDPYTKVYAYVNSNNTNVTSSGTSSIDSTGILISLNVTVALEGYYRTILNRHYKRDTVTIILRHSVSPFSVLDSVKSVVDSATLTAPCFFRNVPNGNFYIVVRHRNSIETWSKPGGEPITVGIPYNYDFTTAQSQAFGNNLKLIGTKWCIYTGDVTQSGFIDALDMMNVDNDIFVFRTGYVPTDLNGDNFVDIDDLGMIDNNVRRWIGVERPWTMEAIMTEKVNYNP